MADRVLVVVRGTPGETEEAAARAVAHRDDVWWAGRPDPGGRAAADLRRRLGAAVDAIVLDLHEGFDPDLLGVCHGFVRGGGGLVLRLPATGRSPDASRSWSRLERLLPRGPLVDRLPDGPAPPEVGTDEQAQTVRELVAQLGQARPAVAVVIADRGRGKSSAVGLALGALPSMRVVVVAEHADAVATLVRFAGRSDLVLSGAADLLLQPVPADVVVVDEAATLPLSVLARLVEAFPEAHFVFATTTHGYEGSGRGFVLRFLSWLRAGPRPCREWTLRTPIRWSVDDPLERWVYDLLLLDAEPPDPGAGPVTVERLDRDALLADEPGLRGLFGLLVSAHYRTVPSDLARLLDAPNVSLHAAVRAGRRAGVCLVAEEGGLSRQTCDAMAEGRIRIRGHALADTIVCHSGHRDAGALSMIRSVRIAVHPDSRRQGLGAALVAHVHETYTPDLFGTIFGATAALVRFRRALGYVPVRLGSSRGARTGEPSVVMIRPVSPASVVLVDALRGALARDLDAQLALLHADGAPVEAALVAELASDLPAPADLTEVWIREATAAFATGPRPFEAAPAAIRAAVLRRSASLGALEPSGRALIEGRILEGRAWVDLTREGGFPSVPAAMRALRRAFRALAAFEPDQAA